MNVISMAISDVKLPERNVRIHAAKQIEEFKRSVKMFGQIRPIVVDENNVILCGNGLYETLKQLNYSSVDVYKVEGLSEANKKKLMLADNKIYGLGIDDIDVFDQFINELKDDLDIPGYDSDVLQSMVSEAEEITEKIADYGTVADEVKDVLNRNGERKEYLINNRQEEEITIPSVTKKAVFPHRNNAEPLTTEREDSDKYIVCPKCGEKIWL